MDSRRYQLITSEIEKQIEEIERVLQTLLERNEQIARGEAVILEGAAFHLHNYYSAVEDLLKIVAVAFENNISDVSRWHSELIDRMTIDIEGVRPRLLSGETAALLHRVRSFRHFFRHAYRVDLDGAEIQENIDRVIKAHPLLLADITRFLSLLQRPD